MVLEPGGSFANPAAASRIQRPQKALGILGSERRHGALSGLQNRKGREFSNGEFLCFLYIVPGRPKVVRKKTSPGPERARTAPVFFFRQPLVFISDYFRPGWPCWEGSSFFSSDYFGQFFFGLLLGWFFFRLLTVFRRHPRSNPKAWPGPG